VLSISLSELSEKNHTSDWNNRAGHFRKPLKSCMETFQCYQVGFLVHSHHVLVMVGLIFRVPVSNFQLLIHIRCDKARFTEGLYASFH
jgi:hypothetical protein